MGAARHFWNFIGRLDPFAKGHVGVRDLARYPIWEPTSNTEGVPWRDETWRRPLKRKTIPWEGHSLTVAATLSLPSGQAFDGAAYVSTDGRLVTVNSASLLIGSEWYFIPNQGRWSGFESQSELFFAALGMTKEAAFPVRWTLKVPMEGEANLRFGEIEARAEV